jgi:hypothetical protein
MTIPTAITIAKIGRLMKKFEITARYHSYRLS